MTISRHDVASGVRTEVKLLRNKVKVVWCYFMEEVTAMEMRRIYMPRMGFACQDLVNGDLSRTHRTSIGRPNVKYFNSIGGVTRCAYIW